MHSSIRLVVGSLVGSLVLAACAQGKGPVDDDFSALGQDVKSDAFSSKMKIVGSLDYGQTSATVRYTKSPKYRAFKFGGNAGDVVDVWVRSTHGDAVAWVLDNDFHVVASNDDADTTTLDAHVHATLPANASITHYVVFRDYGYATHDFTVALAGTSDWAACATDADCTAVPTGGCCPDGSLTAVNVDGIDAYDTASACTANPRPLCPQHLVVDDRVAQCDTTTKHCAMIEPTAIHCGGNILGAHACPDGFHCQLVVNRPDTGGSCVAN